MWHCLVVDGEWLIQHPSCRNIGFLICPWCSHFNGTSPYLGMQGDVEMWLCSNGHKTWTWYVINKYIHFYMKQLSILNQILIECCGRSDPTKYHAIEIKHQNDRTREWAALYFNDDLGSGLDPFVERMVNLLVSFFPLLSSSFVIINEIDDTTQNVDHFQNWKNCSMAFLRYKSRG